MNEQDRQELSGRLYANELILNVLLKDYVTRNADTGADTEHLEAFVNDLQRSFSAQAPKMSPTAAKVAEQKIFALLDSSLHKYWT